MINYLVKLLLVGCVWSVSCAISAEVPSSGAPFELGGIKEAYIFPEAVTVKITNVTSGIVVYEIGIQRLYGERWQDFMTNMDDSEPFRMVGALRKINAHESKSFTWEPKKIPKTFGPTQGTYRVCIIYDVGKEHERFYSQVFLMH